MKVLIVDDEKHVREGVRLLGEWEQHGITAIMEAANGEEAVEWITKHRPEIIFTDMKMPKMDGIQLLEWVKQHVPTSKVIVLTGYDDYHYMRKAITFGSTDYLLKPIDPDILNQTLATAVSAWKKEAIERKKKDSTAQLVNKMMHVYRDRKLTQLLNQDSETMGENTYDELGFQVAGTYRVALVRVSWKTIEAFAGDRDLAYFTILNVINEVFLEKEMGVGFRYLSHKGEIVIICWDQFEELEATLTHIFKMLRKVMDISCPISIGRLVNHRAALKDSYEHAKRILLNSNLLEDKANRVYSEVNAQPSPSKNLMDYTSSIEMAMQTGKMGAFIELIDQIERELTDGNYLSYRQLLQLENEYLLLSQRWFQLNQIGVKVAGNAEIRIDRFLDSQGNFLREDFRARKIREIKWFLERVKRNSRRKPSNSIYEIESYLQANFDRDVKLQEISEHFYMSREYISRKFKQEFQVNISDYIVKIRMKKAKSLLENSDLKIYEIANMIGYQDDKYFRKVFKKIEGVTPNEYRAKIK